MNRRQLRGWQERSRSSHNSAGAGSARTRGMEALGEVQHRAKAKLRKAVLIWGSLRVKTTPYIQSRRDGSGDGGGTKVFIPDPVRTPRVRDNAVGSAATQARGLPWVSKGSSRITSYEAEKPGNAGGAKGVTS